MKKESFPKVHPKDDGIRPAGPPDACYFCRKKVGTQHKRRCIAVRKKVRLRLTIDIVVDERHGASIEEIEHTFDHMFAIEEIMDGQLIHADLLDVIDPSPGIKIKTEEQWQQYGRLN